MLPRSAKNAADNPRIDLTELLLTEPHDQHHLDRMDARSERDAHQNERIGREVLSLLVAHAVDEDRRQSSPGCRDERLQPERCVCRIREVDEQQNAKARARIHTEEAGARELIA